MGNISHKAYVSHTHTVRGKTPGTEKSYTKKFEDTFFGDSYCKIDFFFLLVLGTVFEYC